MWIGQPGRLVPRRYKPPLATEHVCTRQPPRETKADQPPKMPRVQCEALRLCSSCHEKRSRARDATTSRETHRGAVVPVFQRRTLGSGEGVKAASRTEGPGIQDSRRLIQSYRLNPCKRETRFRDRSGSPRQRLLCVICTLHPADLAWGGYAPAFPWVPIPVTSQAS